MPHPRTPWWLAALGLACCGAPPLDAASSSKTVGVRIIIPPRQAAAAATAQAAPVPESSPAPAASPAATPAPARTRTTTLVHDGGRAVLLVTDTPLL